MMKNGKFKLILDYGVDSNGDWVYSEKDEITYTGSSVDFVASYHWDKI